LFLPRMPATSSAKEVSLRVPFAMQDLCSSHSWITSKVAQVPVCDWREIQRDLKDAAEPARR
jgi:hypothetical protein